MSSPRLRVGRSHWTLPGALALLLVGCAARSTTTRVDPSTGFRFVSGRSGAIEWEESYAEDGTKILRIELSPNGDSRKIHYHPDGAVDYVVESTTDRKPRPERSQRCATWFHAARAFKRECDFYDERTPDQAETVVEEDPLQDGHWREVQRWKHPRGTP